MRKTQRIKLKYRMSGVKGAMRKNGKPTRKALALRKWKC